MSQKTPKQAIGLAKVIAELRRELAEAITEGEGQALRFELGEIELDLEVVLAESASAELGFKVLLGSLGDNKSESRTQRLKVRLRPVGEGPGGSVRASG